MRFKTFFNLTALPMLRPFGTIKILKQTIKPWTVEKTSIIGVNKAYFFENAIIK